MNPKTENGYANRAVLFQTINRHPEAIADFYRHMEVNHQQSADILNSIAISYLRQKDFKNALKVLTQTIDLDPQGIYYRNRALVYGELGRRAEAKADALKAQSLGTIIDPKFLNSLGK